MVTTTTYYHAAYAIATAVYAVYVISLFVRAKRARAKLTAQGR